METELSHESDIDRPLVAVVGGGFAGLSAVKALRKTPVDVVLIDSHNYHLFTPLLYQVASALLDPSEIAHSARAIVRGQKNVHPRMATVSSVDLDARRLSFEDGDQLRYDYLILAAGSVSNYYGNEDLRRETFPLKNLTDALALRYRVLERFELASATTDPVQRARLMRFAIVGGGATGVELAGALSELVRLVLHMDFPELDMSETRIILVNADNEVLEGFHPGLRRAAARALKRKGVDLILGARVLGLDNDGRVRLTDDRSVDAGTVIWTAGVKAAELGTALGVPLTSGGRVPVEPTLQVKDHREVFVAGDLAAVRDKGVILPMLSPVAIQEGRQAARNVAALVEGRPLAQFHYRNLGTMATIGRNQAVAELGPLRLHGFPAWLTWLFVHLILIIGFRNRLIALLDWAIDYLFYDRPVRLITSLPRQLEPTKERGVGLQEPHAPASTRLPMGR